MKLPGPDHPITISATPNRVQVLFHGHLLADTERALTLKEATYPPVFYIPREDAEMSVLGRTQHSTYCPYKGEASYYSIARDGAVAENAVWSYEAPYPAMEQIKGYLAFYPNQVEFVEIEDPRGQHAIADIVEHTDSGSGASQLDHWPTNVDGPTGNPHV